MTGPRGTNLIRLSVGRKQDERGIRSYLEHHVNGTPVGGDGHRAALWGGLGGRQGDDGLGIRQRLNLRAVFLHQRHGGGVYALKVTCRETGPITGADGVVV